jgi:acyl-[acyl-carrier-protein]-phospholipid O-acyltransferase/long-chain-fatty-acid--[acyl-carrier-protein] ligase
MSESEDTLHSETRGGLRSRSFLGLLATQFLGAANDNIFRWVVVSVAQPIVGTAEALSMGLACFTVPYLLLATASGYLADRFSKRSVIIGCKVAEVVIMALGIVAMLAGNAYLLFTVVALMGCQSALFGPSKLGSIPEMLKDKHLSTGNGLMGLTTVVASALGTIAGYWLYDELKLDLRNPRGFAQLWPVAAVLIGVAIAGWLTSFLIARLPIANPEREKTLNPITDTYKNLKLLAENVSLMRAALGISFFWLLASLAQMNIDPFGDYVLGLSKKEIGPLLGIMVAGVGLGSVLAGIWSGGKVELGIVPLGATGVAISSLFLFLSGSSVDPDVAVSAQQAYFWSCVWLFALGASAGLFNVPLAAFLQHRSDVKNRGTILAASNFIAFSFILAASGLFYLMQTRLEMSASEVFLVAGLGTIPVIVYVFGLLPTATIRFVVWLFSHTVYRLRVYDQENIPETGGALLVPNHVSWIDGVLVLLASSRPVRMLVYADYTKAPFLRGLAKLFDVIPIDAAGGPKAIVRSLQTAREAVMNGELVCIFAEGEITRTGHLQPFQRGLLKIIRGTEKPVIPVYLDELWGSIFSFRGGRFFWKRPRVWPYPVSISFGKPLTEPESASQVREAVQNLGVESIERRKERGMIPQRQFIRQCRRKLFSEKIADSSGTQLTGGKLLAGVLAFKRVLKRNVIATDEDMVGVLLPPSAGAVIANASLSLMQRVAVNLNYTLSESEIQLCIRQCNIRHVLTSRRFLEKRPMNLDDVEVVYMEDLKEQIGRLDKCVAFLQTFILPAAVLERIHGLTRINPDDLLTVIFTSGSTGEPKGVMLSHHNIGSNIGALNELLNFTSSDVLLGVLPFFHSFGYTIGLWLIISYDPKGVYHFNPIDSRQIGKLAERHGISIVITTPTFLRSYLKRCTQEQFSKLDLVVVGAEKLPLELAKACQEKFGIEPTEGYGTTELSPVAIANVPDHRSQGGTLPGTKLGTVGRPLPGIVVKIVDPESGKDLGLNTEGLLMIKGPNVMVGYLDQPEKTAEVIRDGWYDTGDIGKIDDEGFVEITGRQSRFSKIGGEMVPHIKIEQTLARIIDNAEQDDEPDLKVAVTAVPDQKKGERIIVVHKPFKNISVENIIKQLADEGLPNLWIPSQESFLEVDQIPVLGTGKLDLKSLKQLAMDHFNPQAGATSNEN